MKLSWEVLDGLLHQLTGRIWDEKIDADTYVEEYNKILEFAGWTDEELKEEVGRRWEMPRRQPVVFEC